ncbi:putative pentatricopeptide repeat-containing protein, partial [Cucurbita argyrosperma subsp. argyrosperma]
MEEFRDAGRYINLSNIYAVAGQWDNVSKVKKVMRDRGVSKVPAYSWVEIKHQTHVFSATDKSHPRTKKILRKIDALTMQMDKKGYKPDITLALHDMDKDINIDRCLSIAFALLNTPDGSPIRETVMLQIAIKVISQIVIREITVRDLSRIDHFKDDKRRAAYL